ncbi:hypothetical protein QN277_018230 [Acacia crassicarpa]|uniref:Secreted protein n=1 Tax=Acacia crassicarpa TaxID=499986 RepID=A0AAE1JR31_9FABA|nr:hypothetical protein QN277_018230 [Acacia crassicarpa]
MHSLISIVGLRLCASILVGLHLCAVAVIGEEGTPRYIGPRLILFGGATALEGNSTASRTPSSVGNAGIQNS